MSTYNKRKNNNNLTRSCIVSIQKALLNDSRGKIDVCVKCSFRSSNHAPRYDEYMSTICVVLYGLHLLSLVTCLIIWTIVEPTRQIARTEWVGTAKNILIKISWDDGSTWEIFIHTNDSIILKISYMNKLRGRDLDSCYSG
jgi:hypothetical protein